MRPLDFNIEEYPDTLFYLIHTASLCFHLDEHTLLYSGKSKTRIYANARHAIRWLLVNTYGCPVSFYNNVVSTRVWGHVMMIHSRNKVQDFIDTGDARFLFVLNHLRKNINEEELIHFTNTLCYAKAV